MSDFQVLLIDPNKMYAEKVATFLKDEGYAVHACQDAQDGVNYAHTTKPNLILTELSLGYKDGIDLCREFRKEPSLSHAVLFVLSHDTENYVKITALNSGADDFISKPFSLNVLLSKIRVWERRMKPIVDAEKTKNRAGVFIDRERYVIVKNRTEFSLPKKEFEIFSLLHSKPEKVFSRDEIKASIWERQEGVRHRTIDVHIRKLRSKIGDELIQTIKGVGYKFVKAS